MNAVLAPRADTPERYPGRSAQEKARLIRAEVQFITRLHRHCAEGSVAWRCHVCGGRIDLSSTRKVQGRQIVTTTRGKCRTAGCLDWED